MQYMCPCLNIKIETSDELKLVEVDSTLHTELIKDDVIKNYEDFIHYNINNKTLINIEYKELVGVIKRNKYSIIKCFGCNLFSHISSIYNDLFINKKMICDELVIEKIKNNEDYSSLFKIVLNKNFSIGSIIQREDIISCVSNNELKDFPRVIEKEVNSFLANERTKIENELQRYHLEYDRKFNILKEKTLNQMNIFNNLITFLNKNIEININKNVSFNKLNEENSITHASVESGYIDDNSNSSDKVQLIFRNDDNKSVYGPFKISTLDLKKKDKDKKSLFQDHTNQVFCFEDQDDNYFNDKNDDIDESLNNEIDEFNENVTEQINNGINFIKEYKENKIDEINSKYSCSLPQSIPSSFSNREEFKKNKEKNVATNEDDNDIDDNPDLGAAFAQLASSIVYKDGTELFGGRPSRRVPVYNISKSCLDN